MFGEGKSLSRPDSKFTAAGEAPLDPAELVAAFEAQLALAKGDRRDAFARFIAGAPDWREARESLSGAFADEGAATKLSGGKTG
jgi:hypothetical protein